MTFAPEKIKALCFDVDGTLSDTDDVYTQTVTRLMPRFLFPQPEKSARRFVMWAEAPGNALLGLADTLGIDDEMIAMIHWLERRRKPKQSHFLLIPSVEEMLRELQGRYPMCVVSARDEKGTLAFLNHFRLAPYFDHIITGLSAEHTKPYPDPILLAAQKMGVRPQDCAMIGDTTVDIRAGKSAGAQTVGVLCGFGERAELIRIGADAVIQSTPDLLALLS